MKMMQRQRKAHHKVKTGCAACKTRRQKCDERRPECANCVRYSTNCVYVRNERASRRQLRGVQWPQSQLVRSRSPPQTSPLPDLNLEDLELLHHYIMSASTTTGQVSAATIQMQTTVPRLAQRHPFLMRGLLAKAAIHLSWSRPSQRSHFTVLAARHHSAALPEFRTVLQNADEDSHLALILYAKGLVWCSFASHDERSADHTRPTSYEGISNWLPNWFNLLRGSCLIVEFCKPWIQHGLHILPPPLDDLTEFSNSSDNRRISALVSQLVPLIESDTCNTVLAALHEAFARASMRHHNTPLRNAINFWVGALPNEYLDVVIRRESWALVIMAHFCILVSRSETQWFMRGHAAKLLRSVVEYLPVPWRHYIQWPCDEVGFISSALELRLT